MGFLQRGDLPNLGPELAKTAADRKGKCIVSLHDKGLVQTNSVKEWIEFDFDLKFSFNEETFEVTFEKDKVTLTYKLSSQKDLATWRRVLKKKLNQRGFHEQFKAIKKIGKGNFASVYLVQKNENGQKYAVKAFSKEAAYSEQKGKECLIKQIEVMRQLSHPNNMTLHEVFESDNSLYIIFELLEGGSLHDKIKSKYKFKEVDIKNIIRGILQGLNEMCDRKIMHRDLKPENLLFRTESSMDIVIADFGLSQFSDANEYLFVRCGTPGYVAPEVINIRDMKTKYTPICDIFSLGLIFHLLLYGKSAFPGKNYDQVLSQNRASNINLKGDEFLKHGAKALDLLQKMLKKSPKERITAKECLKHPYFTDGEEQVEDMKQQVEVDKYPQLDSPLFASNNQQRKVLTKKDSCLQFQMGKENIINGKTQTVGTMGSPKLSGFNNMQPNKSPGASKFARRQ